MTEKRRTRERIQSVGRSPYITTIIVLLASACDFVTIQSVTEYYLTESIIIQVVVTGAVAFILNYLPSLLGKALRDKKTPYRNLVVTVLLVSFLILFLLTFLLRWNSRELMFQDTAVLNLMSDKNSEVETVIGAGENTLTIIMGSSTLFTSILSFVFSFIEITPEEKKRQIIELRLIELENELDVYQAHIDELQRIIDEDANAKREEGAYQAALKSVEDYKILFKEETRMALAESLHNADAVSMVLQKELPVMI